MPPWSDIRTQAQSLIATRQYVTFLDIIPLQRLAQTMVHLPEASVQALIALHDAPATTLGAQDLLAEVLRGYNTRKTNQRALAKKIITMAHHGQSVRLTPGDHLFIALAPSAQHTWQVVDATQPPTPCITVFEVAALNRREQRFVVTATAVGHGHLEGHQNPVAQVARPVRGQPQATPPPKGGANRKLWRLTVIVEEPPSL